MKLYLGGTENGSEWRKELIKLLSIDYSTIKKDCDINLYVITPKVKEGDILNYSDCNIFVTLLEDGDDRFNKDQRESLKKVAREKKENGVAVLGSLMAVAEHVNKFEPIKKITKKKIVKKKTNHPKGSRDSSGSRGKP